MHSKGGRPMRVWLMPGARAVFSSGMGEMLGLSMPRRHGPDGEENNPLVEMLRFTTMNSRSVSERLALTVRVRTLRRSNDFGHFDRRKPGDVFHDEIDEGPEIERHVLAAGVD